MLCFFVANQSTGEQQMCRMAFTDLGGEASCVHAAEILDGGWSNLCAPALSARCGSQWQHHEPGVCCHRTLICVLFQPR